MHTTNHVPVLINKKQKIMTMFVNDNHNDADLEV